MSGMCIGQGCENCKILETCWVIPPWMRAAAERIVFAREVGKAALEASLL